MLFMIRHASVSLKVSGPGFTAIALVVILMATASCLAGVADAATPDRLYAAGFDGPYLPPGHSINHGNNDSSGNFIGNACMYVIDPEDGRLISSMPMNEAGYFLAVSPSVTRVYSTNGYSRNITVVDLINQSATAEIRMNTSPCGIALSPDGTRIYVALPEEKAVVVLDASTYATRSFIPLNVLPYSLAVSSDGMKLYATSSLNGTISVIDLNDNRLLSTLPVGPGLSEAVFARNNTVFVAGGNDTLYVIDAASNVVKSAIKDVIAPAYLAFDASKNALIVTSLSDKNITRIDASGYNVAVTRAFWSSFYGRPAVSSDGSVFYVTDDNGKIRVINASSLVETGVISTAYPVTAVAYMPPQADVARPPLSPTASIPSPVPSGTTGPKISMPPRPSPGYVSYKDWKLPFDIRPITTGDITVILLCFTVILVVLSGITYMMMFRKKKE